MTVPYDSFEKKLGNATADVVPELVPCDVSRILVVDDEMRVREVFRMILSDGFPDKTIDTAANGQEALDSFATLHHKVCLMDLHMSVMDGHVAFLKILELCAERKWEAPSVVFCTGFAHPDAVRSVVVRDSTHCLLSKPVRAETLLNIVRSRLETPKHDG
jgi:CheY-like chemotaxis protein